MAMATQSGGVASIAPPTSSGAAGTSAHVSGATTIAPGGTAGILPAAHANDYVYAAPTQQQMQQQLHAFMAASQAYQYSMGIGWPYFPTPFPAPFGFGFPPYPGKHGVACSRAPAECLYR